MKSLDDQFDDFLANIEPLSDLEKAELVLRYFTAVIEGFDTQDLVRFRTHVLKKHPGTKDENTVIEVIDGQLALRELRTDTSSKR